MKPLRLLRPMRLAFPQPAAAFQFEVPRAKDDMSGSSARGWLRRKTQGCKGDHSRFLQVYVVCVGCFDVYSPNTINMQWSIRSTMGTMLGVLVGFLQYLAGAKLSLFLIANSPRSRREELRVPRAGRRAQGRGGEPIMVVFLRRAPPRRREQPVPPRKSCSPDASRAPSSGRTTRKPVQIETRSSSSGSTVEAVSV